MGWVLGIDPGPDESAFALVERPSCRPLEVAKVPNVEMLDWLRRSWSPDVLLGVEMVQSFGMPVGIEVFQTCVWIGRFVQLLEPRPVELVPRGRVKLHHCQSAAAKDSNIVQALVDRFAPGAPNFGKGTRDAPGWFRGFAGDIWQAYALAVLLADGGAG